MADILIDVEVRGNQKVTTAVKNVQTLQTNVKRLSDAMSKGSLSQRQYYKGISQLAEATGKSEKELRDYATALRRVEKETKAAKVAQDQEREAVKAYAQARREATAANQRYDAELKKKAKSEEEASRAAAKHASEMEQIKNKYVPLYAASKQYERAIEELNQAYVQGALTQGQYLAAMENIDRQLANNRAAAVGNVRGMNAMGVAIQQTGYQVGDFLVQIQSGTNAFVAFGQQATQLVGVLPMFNPALVGISAALGIIIPLATAFGAAWMRTRDAANSISDVTSEVESATSALKELNREVNNFNQGITSSFDEMLAGLELNIELARKAIEDMQKSNPLFTLPGSGFRMSARVEELRAAEEALRLAKELVAERERQRQAEKTANDERLLGEQMLQAAREESLRIYEEEQRLLEETNDYILEMEKVFKDAQKRMRDEEIAATEAALDRLFRNRTVMYSIRFSGEETVMSQPVIQPPTAPAPPSYKEAVRLGLTQDQMKILGVDIPRASSGGGGGGGASGPNPIEQAQEYLEKIQREAEFKRTLVGLTDEQATQEERRNQLLTQLNGYEEGLGEQYSERINQIIQMEAETRKLMEAEQQREQMMNTITSNIESAFMSVVDGSKSVEDAFKGMLRNIILAIYQRQVAQPAATAIGDIIKSFFANGGAFNKGVQFYAKGDVFNSPTAFSHQGGLGVMGEAGPEAIMPLKRGKNGKLGVQMEGSGGGVTIHQNFNFSANGDDSVKRIIRGEIPRITEATKAAVVDAKRRGGSYGRSF